jgi:hypothetical protein
MPKILIKPEPSDQFAGGVWCYDMEAMDAYQASKDKKLDAILKIMVNDLSQLREDYRKTGSALGFNLYQKIMNKLRVLREM